MQFRLQLTRDTLTPHLARKLKAAGNPQPVLAAVGTLLVASAKRAFDEPSLRPAKWPALKPATIKAKARKKLSSGMLRGNGTLWQSLRTIGVTGNSVSIGSDRFYAKFHQLGTRRIPARPFFPFDARGKLTPRAADRVQGAIHKWLMQ